MSRSKHTIFTKQSLWEKLADYAIAVALGCAIAFGLVVYFS